MSAPIPIKTLSSIIADPAIITLLVKRQFFPITQLCPILQYDPILVPLLILVNPNADLRIVEYGPISTFSEILAQS